MQLKVTGAAVTLIPLKRHLCVTRVSRGNKIINSRYTAFCCLLCFDELQEKRPCRLSALNHFIVKLVKTSSR